MSMEVDATIHRHWQMQCPRRFPPPILHLKCTWAASAHLVLADGALPLLRELKVSSDVVNAIVACPSLT